MSCCGGNCGCGSGCQCGTGCGGYKMYPEMDEGVTTSQTLVMGVAPSKGNGPTFEAAAENGAVNGGCKCGLNCTCNPCTETWTVDSHPPRSINHGHTHQPSIPKQSQCSSDQIRSDQIRDSETQSGADKTRGRSSITMSCCGGNCGCGSGCQCGTGCGGAGMMDGPWEVVIDGDSCFGSMIYACRFKMYPEMDEGVTTCQTLVMGVAPSKGNGPSFEAAAENGGCKCGPNCTCNPCTCK